MINKKNFYAKVRKSFDRLSQSQVEGFEAILDEFIKKEYEDIRWLAYMLATTWHETAKTMQPINEYGKGGSRPYGKKLKHSKVAYVTPNKLYYGRGFVQLTWYENYQLLGRLLGIDLLNNPELALDIDIATQILFEGMTKGSSSVGDFTGRCLEMYFNDTVENPIGARKIINGTDKAELIAIYYKLFKEALL